MAKTDVAAKSLEELSEPSKILYARALLAQASADNNVSPREIADLYVFMAQIGLTPKGRSAVLGQLSGKGRSIQALARSLEEEVDASCREQVRFSLIKDLIRISKADSVLSTEEKKGIRFTAKATFPARWNDVIGLCKLIVSTDRAAVDGKLDQTEFDKANGEIRERSKSLGLPIDAICFSGSVVGLGAQGLLNSEAGVGLVGTGLLKKGGLASALSAIAKLPSRLGGSDSGQRTAELRQALADVNENAIKAIKEDIVGLRKKAGRKPVKGEADAGNPPDPVDLILRSAVKALRRRAKAIEIGCVSGLTIKESQHTRHVAKPSSSAPDNEFIVSSRKGDLRLHVKAIEPSDAVLFDSPRAAKGRLSQSPVALNQLVQTVPNVAVLVGGGKVVRILNPGLLTTGTMMKAKNGVGLYGDIIGHKDPRIARKLQFSDPRSLRTMVAPVAVWQVASLVTMQHHLAGIEVKLRALVRDVRTIRQEMRNETHGEILSAAEGLQRLTSLMENGVAVSAADLQTLANTDTRIESVFHALRLNLDDFVGDAQAILETFNTAGKDQFIGLFENASGFVQYDLYLLCLSVSLRAKINALQLAVAAEDVKRQRILQNEYSMRKAASLDAIQTATAALNSLLIDEKKLADRFLFAGKVKTAAGYFRSTWPDHKEALNLVAIQEGAARSISPMTPMMLELRRGRDGDVEWAQDIHDKSMMAGASCVL